MYSHCMSNSSLEGGDFTALDVDSRRLEISTVCSDVPHGFLGVEVALEDTGEHVSCHSNDTAIEWEGNSTGLVLVSRAQMRSLFKWMTSDLSAIIECTLRIEWDMCVTVHWWPNNGSGLGKPEILSHTLLSIAYLSSSRWVKQVLEK